jgi:hypothetical protein
VGVRRGQEQTALAPDEEGGGSELATLRALTS